MFFFFFPYGRDELDSLMTIENERQGNSVWLCRQWAIGALQSSINSMCTAICSQCLCPKYCLHYKLPHIVMYQMSRLLPSSEFFPTTILMSDKIACVCAHTPMWMHLENWELVLYLCASLSTDLLTIFMLARTHRGSSLQTIKAPQLHTIFICNL